MAEKADPGILMMTLGAIVEKVGVQKKIAEQEGQNTSNAENKLKFYTNLTSRLATKYAEMNRVNCDDGFM